MSCSDCKKLQGKLNELEKQYEFWRDKAIILQQEKNNRYRREKENLICSKRRNQHI